MKMTLYHGTGQETTSADALYFTAKPDEAKAFALALDGLGNYNEESWIYMTEIDTDDVVVEDDFEEFDSMAYRQHLESPIYNPESGWYIVPNPRLTLVEHFTNEL